MTNAVSSYPASIFVAGDIATITDTCREYVVRGLCVTVTPTNFVFTGGSEVGATVGLINYPRFPSEPEAIAAHAEALAKMLMERCFQRSCTIQTPEYSAFLQNAAIEVPR